MGKCRQHECYELWCSASGCLTWLLNDMSSLEVSSVLTDCVFVSPCLKSMNHKLGETNTRKEVKCLRTGGKTWVSRDRSAYFLEGAYQIMVPISTLPTRYRPLIKMKHQYWLNATRTFTSLEVAPHTRTLNCLMDALEWLRVLRQIIYFFIFTI